MIKDAPRYCPRVFAITEEISTSYVSSFINFSFKMIPQIELNTTFDPAAKPTHHLVSHNTQS